MDSRTRFSGLGWFPGPDRPKISITIGGAGGIGSWTSFFLGRIGYQINIFDDDIVELHNLGGQLFGRNDVNNPKVHSVANLLSNYSVDHNCSAYNARIEIGYRVRTPVTISAFDNMEARKNLFESFVLYAEDQNMSPSVVPIFIDGRLEAEQLQVFCVRADQPDQIEKYRETLFSDVEVEDAPCTFKQTSHIACMIASVITTCLTNHIENVNLGEDMREVPFKTEFYAPFLHLTKEI